MPRPRHEPDVRMEVVPNEPMLMVGTFGPRLGDLAQTLIDSADDLTYAVVLDVSARPRPGQPLADYT